jgi:hypothetical protein
MVQVLTTLSHVAVLLFVLTTMVAMGLSLTVPQILEPLRKTHGLWCLHSWPTSRWYRCSRSSWRTLSL